MLLTTGYHSNSPLFYFLGFLSIGQNLALPAYLCAAQFYDCIIYWLQYPACLIKFTCCCLFIVCIFFNLLYAAGKEEHKYLIFIFNQSHILGMFFPCLTNKNDSDTITYSLQLFHGTEELYCMSGKTINLIPAFKTS